MKAIEAIHKIQKSNANQNIKDSLCWLASNFDCFLQLKKRYQKEGLLNACYKEFGLRFIGMYGINTLEDLVVRANNNELL